MLAGKLLAVAGAGPLPVAVASELAALGAQVAQIGRGSTLADVQVIAGGWSSREESIANFARAAQALGGLDGVVCAAGVDGQLEERLLVDTDEAEWDRTAEAPIRQALIVLQGAFAALQDSGGAITVVVPSIALTGAAGLAGFATASEGIRLLVKSGARAWGAAGIRINCVTAPIQEWDVTIDDANAVPNRFGASLPEPSAANAITGAVAMLSSSLAAGVTGATVGADHGTVMAP